MRFSIAILVLTVIALAQGPSSIPSAGGGNASTATALATLPTPCSTGQAPTGILANGNSTGCASISGGGSSTWTNAVATYGFVGDGTTDNTSAWNTALAAAYTRQATTLYFPAGKYTASGQIVFPSSSVDGAGRHIQPSIRITGDGAAGNLWNAGIAAGDTVAQRGTVLAFTYTGPGGGTLQTVGFGILEIDHVTLQSLSSATPLSVSAATNASPVVLTATAHGLASGDTVTLRGATGGWVTLNRTYAVTVTGANTFSVPLDSSAFGALAGTVTVDPTPALLYTTHTALKIHDSEILTVADKQDAIVLGGTLQDDAVYTRTAINDAFGGWGGTIISNNLFSSRRCIYFRSAVNAVTATGNTCWGSNTLTNGAAMEFDEHGGVEGGNIITSNLIEVASYQAGIYVQNSNGNQFIGNSFYDGASIPSISFALTAAKNAVWESGLGQNAGVLDNGSTNPGLRNTVYSVVHPSVVSQPMSFLSIPTFPDTTTGSPAFSGYLYAYGSFVEKCNGNTSVNCLSFGSSPISPDTEFSINTVSGGTGAGTLRAASVLFTALTGGGTQMMTVSNTGVTGKTNNLIPLVPGHSGQATHAGNITTTNLIASPAQGLYRICAYIETPAAAAGTLTVTIGFAGDSGAMTVTPVNALVVSGRTTAGSCFPVFVGSGAITYAATWATPTSYFELNVTAEQLTTGYN